MMMKTLGILGLSFAIGAGFGQFEPVDDAQACDCDVTSFESFEVTTSQVEGPASAVEFWERDDVRVGVTSGFIYVFDDGANASLDVGLARDAEEGAE